jgi:F0F1-type ATP synthase membrane subunit b/b'
MRRRTSDYFEWAALAFAIVVLLLDTLVWRAN